MILWLNNTVIVADELWTISLTKPSTPDYTSQISPGKNTGYWFIIPGIDNPTEGALPDISAAKKGWRTTEKLTGVFDQNYWHGSIKFFNNVAKDAGNFRIDLKVRISKSVNADGSNGTLIYELTSFPLSNSMTAVQIKDWRTRWQVTSKTFTDEYLFLEYEFHVANTPPKSDSDLKFYCNGGVVGLRTPAYEGSNMETLLNNPSGYEAGTKYLDPTYGYADDGLEATSSAAGFLIKYKNYGFGTIDLPIYEVWVELEHSEVGGMAQPFRISWDGGVSWSPWYEFIGAGIKHGVEVTDLVDWGNDELADGTLIHHTKTVNTGGCLAPDTFVNHGIKQFADLRVGDRILTLHDRRTIETIVTATKPHNDEKFYKLCNIKTSEGSVQIAYYHLIKTFRQGWKAAAFIKPNDYICYEWNNRVFYLPVLSNTWVHRLNPIDIKTECGTFLANNVLTHNIYIVK